MGAKLIDQGSRMFTPDPATSLNNNLGNRLSELGLAPLVIAGRLCWGVTLLDRRGVRTFGRGGQIRKNNIFLPIEPIYSIIQNTIAPGIGPSIREKDY